MTNAQLFAQEGKTPVLSNGSVNNGIAGYSALPPTEKGNKITYSDTTTSEAIFYQPEDFIGYPHVQGLYPKNAHWSRGGLLYVVAHFRKCAQGKFDYATKFTRKIAAEMQIKLPVTEDGAPDFALMERVIAELEARHIAELEAYLEACGLQDTHLSLQEEQALAIFSKTASRPQPHKTFRLGDLFTVATPKRKFNANAVEVGGIHPYVVRTSKDNGQRGSILADEQWLNPGNTIAFGQDTATVFYQPKPYFTGDKIKVMALRGTKLSEQVAHYLVTALRAAFANFSWGTTSFNEHVLKEMPLQLPVTAEGEPDYAAMATLISAVEKRVIDRLSAWRKREREATARCITPQ